MADKELQKLKRIELLEMLIEQSKKVDELQKQLDETQKKLESREIAISRAGNIAEASLMLNGVFDAAQEAARQYLENIQKLSGRQEAVCQQLEQETKERCDLLAKETIERCTVLEKEMIERCASMEKETKEKCAAMIAEAEQAVDERWADISNRLTSFYDAHNGLRELLKLVGASHLDFLGNDALRASSKMSEKNNGSNENA